jgi:hypothetical protein
MPSSPQTQSNAATPPAAGRAALGQYYLLRLMGAIFPLAAGLLLYGWRALGLVVLLALSALSAVWVWRKIGPRGAALHPAQALWMAVLLGLMLPAQLLSGRAPGDSSPARYTWTIIPAAGALLAIFIWLSSGPHLRRLHPILATYLLLALTFGATLEGRYVLHRHRLLIGSLTDAVSIDSPQVPRDEAWIHWPRPRPADAVHFESTAAESLSRYTLARQADRPAWFSIDGLLHDAMPPMEDLIIGGHPGPIGASSIIAVLVGGSFLIYRGAIRQHVPFIAVLTAYAWLLVLPIPVAMTENHVRWHSLVLPGAHLDWTTMLTFANYELLASPLVFAALFLATNASICPKGYRAQATYAFIFGTLAAGAQLYVSCSAGPYIALLLAAQLSLWLERHVGGRER